MRNRNRKGSNLRDAKENQPTKKWYSLMNKVWDVPNMEAALLEVKKNRGAPGIDGITIKGFEFGMEDNVQVLHQELKKKEYTPKPVKRVYIPKADGTQRPLGIPTVRDRVVQASVRRIMEPIFEKKFLDCSFGFRPGRDAHMAIKKIRKDLMDGYVYVIDADLKSYFDTIPHEKLIAAIREEVVDGTVIQLIKQFLKAGVMDGGSFHINDKGTPQGGVISPLLANIYLHPLDEIMTERGHRITRYADDFVICCKSQKGAERVLRSLTRFLDQELELTIHPEETTIVNNLQEPFVFLGYEFKGGYWVSPSEKAQKKFKQKVKELTKRNQTVDLEDLVKRKLNALLRGWANYFGHFHGKVLFRKYDAWIRRRLRSVQLRSWRKKRKLHRELRRRKWKGDLPGIRMDRWRSSKSTPVHVAIPNEQLEAIGLVSLVEIFEKHHSETE